VSLLEVADCRLPFGGAAGRQKLCSVPILMMYVKNILLIMLRQQAQQLAVYPFLKVRCFLTYYII
jgi:hypothetical protein